ncbi:MAG: peptidoglycan-binding domain-containing protein [Actinomycetota bacterium]|nr:peptidoglycan-binding domain-containing protein [Actinomycetota bacterium]
MAVPSAKRSKAPWFVAAGAILVAAAAIVAVLVVRSGEDAPQTAVTSPVGAGSLPGSESTDDRSTDDTTEDATDGTSNDTKTADTTIPIATPNTPSATATTAPTTAPTTASTPATPAPTAAASYPVSVPSGFCTADAIDADTGLRPVYGPLCIGAWVVTMVNECPADAECEGADVFRWTSAGWTYRGYFYAMCAPALAQAGMPPSIGVEFVGTWDACDWEKYVVPEPSTGALELADEGPRVRALQLALIQRGLLFDVADGQFGPNTEAAVRDLQFLTGLEPDGIAGAATHAKLGLPYA